MDQNEEPCQRCGKADCRRSGEAVRQREQQNGYAFGEDTVW